MANGKITFSVDLDNKDAEKQLTKLKGSIKKTEEEIAATTSKRDAASQKSSILGATIEGERKKLAELKAQLEDVKAAAKDNSISPGTREELSTQVAPALRQEIAEQQQRVNALQREWNTTTSAAERYDQQLADANTRLSRQTSEAGQLQQQLNDSSTAGAQMRSVMADASAHVDKFANRIKGLAKRVFIFTMITKALRALRTWLGNVVQQNTEAQAAIARLKGALLTLAQPLLNVIIPAFITLVNALSKVVAGIAKVISSLFGTTIQKSAADAAKNLAAEQGAIKGVGDAAKKAEGSLASFDEINTIETDTDGGGGGGGGAAAEVAPDFTWMDGVSDRLADVAKWVMLIGAGFALWKVSKSLPGILGTVATVLGGITIAVGGLLLAWNGIKDAWNNGVNWGNILETIVGLATAAGGLYIAVSKLAPLFLKGTKEEVAKMAGHLGKVAAGIALVVGGLVMLVTGFRDAMNNGVNFHNTLLQIAGILAAGIGISLMVGSWIPALIAGIAALLLAFTNATGHGEELIQGFRDILSGFKDFFVGIFTGDLSKALGGLEGIFTGFSEFFGAIWAGLRDTVNGFLDWLDQVTGGKLSPIIDYIRTLFNTWFSSIVSAVGSLWTGLQEVLSGIITFISGVFTGDWSKAWEGIKEIFSGIWDGITGVLKTAANLVIGLVEGLINLAIDAINLIIAGINGVGSLADKIGLGWYIEPLDKFTLPRLAEGAVIPPNREFMAVLGDQKSGNNIEAPEDLIRKIVREESGGGNEALLRQILSAIKAGHVLVADKRELAKVAVDGINDMTTRTGRPVLKL